MTTTKCFTIEYYDDDQAEDSDPDPMFTHESDNTDDLWVALSTELAHVQNMPDITYIYADIVNGCDLRYHVFNHATKTAIGVAIIVYP